MSDSLPSRQQWHLAGWTGGPFSLLTLRPILSFSLSGTFLNELRFQLADQFPGLHSISSKVALGWDPFQAAISRMISSLSSLELFSSCIFFSAFSFWPSFLSRKMKHSRIFPIFRMLCVFLPRTHKALPILPLFPLSGDLFRAKK